jgi:hypothetical protein
VLTGYHPDFLDETEASAKVKGLGRKSHQLLQRSVTPSRLLAPLVMPDLNEVLPGINLSIYAPNGLVSLEDSCTGAEGAARGNPQLAKNVLEFAGKPARLDRNGRLFAYYDRRDGHTLGEQVLSTTGYACLARLAAATKDRASIAKLKPVLLGDIHALLDASQTQAAPLYGAGPLLLAADALNAL